MPATTGLQTLTGVLTPRSPFDGAKSLQFLQAFSPTSGEQSFTATAMTKALTLHGRAIAFTVRNVGTIDAPALAYTLHAERAISAAEHAALRDRIRCFLSLDDDLAPFYASARDDSRFAPIIKRFYGLHQPTFLTPFEIACWAVLGQHIPMPVAHRIKLDLARRWGTSITLAGATYWAFPEVAQLAEAAPDELAAVVRNVRKVEYLQAVTRYFQTVDETWLRTGPFTEVAASIQGIRGIGAWSAHFILARGLGRMEHIAPEDRKLGKALAILYNDGSPLTVAEIAAHAARYGAQQGYWAYYARIGALQMVGKD
jgi:DNA-3-methyladenine glycosylase II